MSENHDANLMVGNMAQIIMKKEGVIKIVSERLDLATKYWYENSFALVACTYEEVKVLYVVFEEDCVT